MKSEARYLYKTVHSTSVSGEGTLRLKKERVVNPGQTDRSTMASTKTIYLRERVFYSTLMATYTEESLNTVNDTVKECFARLTGLSIMESGSGTFTME